MPSLWTSRGVVVDLRNWQGKGLYEGFKGHNGDPSELQSHGAGVETKPDHALFFATEGLGAVGSVGADWVPKTERWPRPGVLGDKAATCVFGRMEVSGSKEERVRGEVVSGVLGTS